MSKILIVFLLFLFIVKGELFDYNKTNEDYTYDCTELYKQKEILEQQIYTNNNIRQLYKEISQMIYQLCYYKI